MKKFLAVIIGVSLSFSIIAIGAVLVVRSFGTPGPVPDLDAVRAMVGSLSVVGLIMMILSHAIGSLIGGLAVGFILKEDTMNVGLTLGAVLTILGLVNMIVFTSYPEWFYLDFIVFIPCSMAGATYTSKL
ncbi:MAG: hypothetical protein K9G46_04210 [Flavobacteriales bacterium]|nr:hypothetical protein [Flavobacteriales bacterium]